jgi:hypothetical protein
VLGSNGTENALKLSGDSLLGRLGRVSERPKLPALDRVGQRERIPTEQVDVVVYQGREAGKVLRLYWVTLSSKLLKGSIEIERVPEHDNVDDEPECSELVFLPLPIALA